MLIVMLIGMKIHNVQLNNHSINNQFKVYFQYHRYEGENDREDTQNWEK